MCMQIYIYTDSICYHHTTEFLTTFRTPVIIRTYSWYQVLNFMCKKNIWYKILEVCHYGMIVWCLFPCVVFFYWLVCLFWCLWWTMMKRIAGKHSHDWICITLYPWACFQRVDIQQIIKNPGFQSRRLHSKYLNSAWGLTYSSEKYLSVGMMDSQYVEK